MTGESRSEYDVAATVELFRRIEEATAAQEAAEQQAPRPDAGKAIVDLALQGEGSSVGLQYELLMLGLKEEQ